MITYITTQKEFVELINKNNYNYLKEALYADIRRISKFYEGPKQLCHMPDIHLDSTFVEQWLILKRNIDIMEYKSDLLEPIILSDASAKKCLAYLDKTKEELRKTITHIINALYH